MSRRGITLCEKKGDSVKVDPTKDLKKDELKEMMNRMDSLSRTLGVLQSRVDFFEKEKARNDAENVKLRGEIEALKANRCGHQSLRLVPANPDITVIKQPEVLPQPRQSNSVKDMDTDDDQGRKNELDELNRLKALKGQGFVRVSPQARAFEKPQTPMFCLTCNVRFENKDALREHRVVCPQKAPSINENSPGPEANAVVGERIQTLNSQQKVAVLNRQARSYNCEECAFQATGGGSSKALLKHFRESGHKTNSLEERCYNCDEFFSTFNDLMIHRREKHIDRINKCRYYAEGSCKFGQRCWYSHEMTRNRDNVASDFRKEKESIPPDVRQSLAVLLEDLLEIHKQRKENMKKPPGA